MISVSYNKFFLASNIVINFYTAFLTPIMRATMRPWELLHIATVPGEKGELRLYRQGETFSIKAGRNELMNSYTHGSEDALAEQACLRLRDRPLARVLIGGLGMGFTLAAALRQLGPLTGVLVAELVPDVVTWNKELLGKLAGYPLEDPRVSIHQGDVGQLIHSQSSAYDAILLDVDNGPEGLTRKENNSLYSPAGLSASFDALRPKGIFGVWSISPDRRFSNHLQQAGFSVDEIQVRAHGNRGGKHTIWLGTKC
jgi:spermidine synthase